MAEFLSHGNYDHMCKHLACCYSSMLSHSYVPTLFNTGVMIPVLKKPSLNPTDPSNYKPIIVSSIFSKLLELLLLPEDVPLARNQFGFRSGFSVSNGLSLLNDLTLLF